MRPLPPLRSVRDPRRGELCWLKGEAGLVVKGEAGRSPLEKGETGRSPLGKGEADLSAVLELEVMEVVSWDSLAVLYANTRSS